ncbi:hypothetical protein FQR65_LT07900 [Abscondita terminalis]|nr:hypothetical protein FQR65_LT07900 [Abscondita terminalis]
MSSIDPAKLKVVELRAELTSRGLDAKGNKPVLVKRLKDALEQELQEEIPDTSIADTSSEDVNTSQESVGDDVQAEPPDKVEEPAEDESKKETEVEETKLVEEPELKPPDEVAASPAKEIPNEEPEQMQEEVVPEEKTASAISENGDNELKEDESVDDVGKVEEAESTEVTAPDVGGKLPEAKGEKRRHSSPSPERVQRKRSKSPIKEDEPAIDNNKVQLSWYDSDLHLQIDKKTFLSGKPYHEGAFGYAWAGARATHGVKAGKRLLKNHDVAVSNSLSSQVYFEVKLTEELKWEDLVKQSDRRRDGHRTDNSKRDRQRSEHASDTIDSKDTIKQEIDIDVEMKEEKADAEIKSEPADDAPKVEPTDDAPKVEPTDDAPKVEPTDAEVKEEKPEVAEEIETKPKLEAMVVEEVPAETVLKHLVRVGWSVEASPLQLGEGEFSYGYESTGKFINNKVFTNCGAKFGVGDVVGVYLDINEERVTFNVTVNGEMQWEMITIEKSEIPSEDFCLFPHVLARNMSFDVNFGSMENPWFPSPKALEDYVFIGNVENRIEGPQRPQLRNECEVIMMCGLPASGKTHWVRNMLTENVDKRYTVIGNSHLLEKMTVNANPLKNNYKGRWNVILDRLMKCVNILVEAAALRRRNFIIDQTNVFPSAQRRKMRLFEGFKRRAVVVVVGDDEQAKRRAQQEAQDGKDVPDSAILEMKANMSLPKRGDWLEEVTYVELNEDEAKAVVQKYNQQGREAGFGPIGGQRSGYRDNRGHPYRWDHSTSRRDYRGGYRDHRHQSNRYDRSRQHGGWHNRRPPPGSWNRDIRRDGRGSSRDYRNNNRSDSGSRPDRSSNRDNRNRNPSGNNYNRNSRSQSSRNQPTNWQGSGNNWQGSQGGNWGGQGMWNQGNWNQSSWGGGGQTSQWKNSYGQGGYSQGGYGNYPSWNYYGYAQNWNPQGQPQTTTAGGTMATDSNSVAYNQYSQQAAWAQYAQQYPQDQTGSSHENQQQSLPK